MAIINADTDKIISYSQEIVNLARELKICNSGINGIKLTGCMEGTYSVSLEGSIRSVAYSVLNEAAKMESMGKALQTIAEKYRATEKANLGILSNASYSETSGERGTDKRNWWNKFVDWVWRREPDSYDTTNIEQEKAADAAMKRRLWNVLQDEKYSQEHWEKASVEERKQILQDYMDQVIVIYGLKDVDRTIIWDKNATYTPTRITWGSYTHDTHTVRLNERALSDSVGNWDSYDLLETVSHELRHAYQHEAVDHPTDYMVTAETIATWKDNFDHYIRPEVDRTGYRNQPVEVDARDFQVNRDNYPS